MTDNTASATPNTSRELTTIILLLVGSFVGALAAMWWYAHAYSLADPTVWGPVGDSLAPVTGLLSSLALGAAVASAILQTRELALQREAHATAEADQKAAIEVARQQVAATEALAKAQGRANALTATGMKNTIAQHKAALAAAEAQVAATTRLAIEQARANDVAHLAAEANLLRARLQLDAVAVSLKADQGLFVLHSLTGADGTSDQRIFRLLQRYGEDARRLDASLRAGSGRTTSETAPG